MKFAHSAVLLAAAALVADARPHRPSHKHSRGLHLRDSIGGYSFEDIQTGLIISFNDACEGVSSGEYHFPSSFASTVDKICESIGRPIATLSPSPSSTVVTSATESPVLTSIAPPVWSTSSTTSATVSTTSATSSTPSASPSSSPSSNSTATGIDSVFPDGELDCSEFPSDYGAIALDYLGLDGWSGIQYVQISGKTVSHIDTAVSNHGTCKNGAMCSYACPPGYLKSQWPETQGSTGQSVGGLRCSNGKLHLTNPTLSQSLCIKGDGNIEAVNKLNEDIAVCRTDYPGTESETVPSVAPAGKQVTLACPDEKTYFKWLNKTTSAQYYVNNKGVDYKKACRWGEPGSTSGNYAPLNLGIGSDIFSVYWLSILPNSPTTNETLDFNVKIDGPDIAMKCKYENGKFYSNGVETPAGCTTSSTKGEAHYIFY